MRMPYVILWSAGLQYEFAHNWVVDMNYQGTAGVGLLENWNINQIPLNVSTNPTVLNSIYQAQQNYLPYPQFGAVNFYSNFGHSTYHSGTVRVEKRYTAGITLMGTFTLSKAIDESDTDGTATGEDYYNRRLEKGDAGYNVPRHFEFLGNYELPVGKGRHFMNRGGVLNAVLGGWNVMNMTELESGTAFSVTFASGPNKYLPGGGVVRPNILVPNGQAMTANWTIGPNRFPTAAQTPYLQFSAFAYPASFTAGTLGRNTFRGPAMDWQQWGCPRRGPSANASKQRCARRVTISPSSIRSSYCPTHPTTLTPLTCSVPSPAYAKSSPIPDSRGRTSYWVADWSFEWGLSGHLLPWDTARQR
jgi:hypothetical protein